MKGFCVIALLLIAGCRPEPPKLKSIGIQVIDNVDPNEVAFVRRQLVAFFHCPVYVLPEELAPSRFVNLQKGERYSADSLLNWLLRRRPDSVSIVLGLIEKDIFTTKPNKPIWGILGLGDCPGRASVVSDVRFRELAPEKYPHRLRTIVLHEIGHNLGLPHCTSPHCIMKDANDKISTVDSSGDEYCAECRRRLGRG